MGKFSFYIIMACTVTAIVIFGLFVWDNGMTYGKEGAQPVIVEGDSVEYSTDVKTVTAESNVIVTYGDTTLRCDKIIVDTHSKDAEAIGNVLLEDKRGILEAERISYNFQSKKGEIISASLRASPYYYFGRRMQRDGEKRYIVQQGYFTSCNYDHPHFRIRSRRVEIFPDDKIIARSNTLYWQRIPLFYFPWYSHSLKDPFMKVQFKAGKSSEWGTYLLSAWRSDLNDNARLRIYLDYRNRLGQASGFGLNYDTKILGEGDFKFYYTQERPQRVSEALRQEFQRYLLRLRHRWDINQNTKLIAEYYRIGDDRKKWDAEADFLQTYFYREYEKDMQPKSYILLTHNRPSYNVNMLFQKRTNRWYDKMVEKLPEISYDFHNSRLGQSPVYFKNQTTLSNLTVKYPAPSELDNDVVRFDTYNQIALPTRLVFLELSPYAGIRETAYSKDNQGASIDPRTTFYTGVDLSTKFYRVYRVMSNFLGLDINNLRHIVSPKIKYGYIHEPTISRSKLQEFDDIDTIASDNRFQLELENKLQTKRKNQSVDLAIFRVSSDYVMYSRKDNLSKAQDRFTDFLFEIELMPYAWLRMEADATYDHRNDYFKEVNFDSWFDFGQGRSFGLGHRYDRSGGKELTSEFAWRINPKWSLRIYERYQFAASRGKGLKEQEYTVSRDLHCATIDISINIKKREDGRREESVWCIFNLKIFKESEFDYAQRYHPPKLSK